MIPTSERILQEIYSRCSEPYSYKDNKLGYFISLGLGTSMLQIGNIVGKPVIWLAPTTYSDAGFSGKLPVSLRDIGTVSDLDVESYIWL